MYGCVTKISEYPNQTRYAEETEPKVSMTPWSIESSNHKQEVESQCQNQQGGYALVWMHHLEMDKPSMQDELWEVCVWHKLSSHKIIIDEWAMPQCKHLPNQTSMRRVQPIMHHLIKMNLRSSKSSWQCEESICPPLKKEHVPMWTDISKINRQWKGYAPV